MTRHWRAVLRGGFWYVTDDARVPTAILCYSQRHAEAIAARLSNLDDAYRETT